MSSINKKAADRGAKGYILLGNSDYSVVVGEPGGETYETRTVSSLAEGEKVFGELVDKHYPAPAKDDASDGDEPTPAERNLQGVGSPTKRDDGLTGDPREALTGGREAAGEAQPTDGSGRPSGSTDAASEKAAKKQAGKAK